MTSEYYRNEIFHKLRVDMLVTAGLGPEYEQLSPKRVWINTDNAPVTTALDLSQTSQYLRTKSYATFRAFIGTEPPENLLSWHLGLRLESVPRILAVSGQHIDDLPRHLQESYDDQQTEKEAVKIAQAAKLVFGHIRTPEGIIALVERLEASDPRAPRVLGITVTGQQALGIRIS